VPSSTFYCFCYFAAPKKGKPSVIARDRESEEGTFAPIASHEFVNTDATIGAIHLATVLPSHPGTSGTKVLSERETVKAWQRDVATRSGYPVQHPYLDVFTPEITPDVTDIRNVPADGI
jgi:hypothetical protein